MLWEPMKIVPLAVSVVFTLVLLVACESGSHSPRSTGPSSRRTNDVSTPTPVLSIETTPTPEPTPGPASTPTPAPTPSNIGGTIPYGIPVPGKSGYVTSPYSSAGYVDVRGFPPNSEVKDPYSGKIFLVP